MGDIVKHGNGLDRKALFIIGFILILFAGVTTEEAKVCKDYETMVIYETAELSKKIEKSKVDFQSEVENLANNFLGTVAGIIQATTNTMMTYLFLALLAVSAISSGITNLILFKKYKNILLTQADNIDKFIEETRKDRDGKSK